MRIPGTPTMTDNSFADQIGSMPIVYLAGSFSNASYAGPLIYVPPCLVSMYVSKCGKTVYGMAQANATTIVRGHGNRLGQQRLRQSDQLRRVKRPGWDSNSKSPEIVPRRHTRSRAASPRH